MAVRILPSFLLLLPFGLRLAAATCYYPNGGSDSSHLPCNASATAASTCCAEDFQCLSNGLCADPRYSNFQRILRGGCTDKNWGAGCPTFCKTPYTDRDQAVTYCGNGKYCCNGDCCGDTAGLLDLGAPVVVALLGESASATASAQDVKSTDASGAAVEASSMATSQDNSVSSSPLASASIPTSPPVATTGPLNTVTVTVIQGHTLTVPVPTTTPDPNALYAHVQGHTNIIALGAGIGVGVGVFMVAMVFGTWIFIRRRRRNAEDRPQGVTSRSVERNPFERREYVVELEGNKPEGVEMQAVQEAKELDGREVPGEDSVEGKREVKTWPL